MSNTTSDKQKKLSQKEQRKLENAKQRRIIAIGTTVVCLAIVAAGFVLAGQKLGWF